MTIVNEGENTQTFIGKSAIGLEGFDDTWSPLELSICRDVVDQGCSLIISDAASHVHYRCHQAIEAFGVGAYLGAPLVVGGVTVGSVCAIDQVARHWSADDLAAVQEVARVAANHLDLLTTGLRADCTEKCLEYTRKSLEDIAKNVPGAIFRYAEFPDETYAVEYLSPGCQDLWEVSAEDARRDPKKLWDLVHPDDLPSMQASVAKSRSNLSDWRHRWRLLFPDGRIKWLDGFGQVTRGPMGETVWNSLALDITTEVEAELKLQENERILQEASKQAALTRLASGIAHDFNNILSVILAGVELIDVPEDDQSQETLLKNMMTATYRGKDLTVRLLSFARKSELNPVSIDVNVFIDDVISVATRTLPANIDIKSALCSDKPHVEIDQGLFYSALLNLFVNASHAMVDGGTLSVTTDHVTLGDDHSRVLADNLTPGLYVNIIVEDTGSGIDPEVIDRIFDPFVTTKEEGEGTGLGLAVVDGFVRQSNGSIKVSSKLNEGTRFDILLPTFSVEVAPDDVLTLPLKTVAAAKALNVLLVEDQDLVRKGIKLLIKSAGHTVIEAADGDEAFEIIKGDQEKIDFIVTDVMMPGSIQGPDLLIKARDLMGDVPAIILSGYSENQTALNKQSSRNTITLMKPASRSTLLTAIDELASRIRFSVKEMA
ncbi:MAG: response regulator [Alphaproteobacteria bacterium]|nr:response regulator [Alphaproteobacteria bacterium SS10]